MVRILQPNCLQRQKEERELEATYYYDVTSYHDISNLIDKPWFPQPYCKHSSTCDFDEEEANKSYHLKPSLSFTRNFQPEEK